MLNTFQIVDTISIDWRRYSSDDLERVTRHQALTSLSIWGLDFIGQHELFDRLKNLFECISGSEIRLTTIGLHCIDYPRRRPRSLTLRVNKVRKLISLIFNQNRFPSLQGLNLSLLNIEAGGAGVMFIRPTKQYFTTHNGNYFQSIVRRAELLYGQFEQSDNYNLDPAPVTQEKIDKLWLFIDDQTIEPPVSTDDEYVEAVRDLYRDCMMMRNTHIFGSILKDLENVSPSFLLTLGGWVDDVEILNDSLRRESGNIAMNVDDETLSFLHLSERDINHHHMHRRVWSEVSEVYQCQTFPSV